MKLSDLELRECVGKTVISSYQIPDAKPKTPAIVVGITVHKQLLLKYKNSFRGHGGREKRLLYGLMPKRNETIGHWYVAQSDILVILDTDDSSIQEFEIL